jgi:hypothetical protein
MMKGKKSMLRKKPTKEKLREGFTMLTCSPAVNDLSCVTGWIGNSMLVEQGLVPVRVVAMVRWGCLACWLMGCWFEGVRRCMGMLMFHCEKISETVEFDYVLFNKYN